MNGTAGARLSALAEPDRGVLGVGDVGAGFKPGSCVFCRFSRPEDGCTVSTEGRAKEHHQDVSERAVRKPTAASAHKKYIFT